MALESTSAISEADELVELEEQGGPQDEQDAMLDQEAEEADEVMHQRLLKVLQQTQQLQAEVADGFGAVAQWSGGSNVDKGFQVPPEQKGFLQQLLKEVERKAEEEGQIRSLLHPASAEREDLEVVEEERSGTDTPQGVGTCPAAVSVLVSAVALGVSASVEGDASPASEQTQELFQDKEKDGSEQRYSSADEASDADLEAEDDFEKMHARLVKVMGSVGKTDGMMTSSLGGAAGLLRQLLHFGDRQDSIHKEASPVSTDASTPSPLGRTSAKLPLLPDSSLREVQRNLENGCYGNSELAPVSSEPGNQVKCSPGVTPPWPPEDK